MEKTDSCTLIGQVELTGVRNVTPSIQLFVFTDSGEVLGFSDYTKSTGSILTGAISWDMLSARLYQFEIHLDLIPTKGEVFPILIRVPKSGNLFSVAESAQYTVFYKEKPSEPIFETDPVSLAEDDGELDWFVLGALLVNRDALKKISSILFRDVSSFPGTKGDIAGQLRDLVESLLEDQDEGLAVGDGWYPLAVPAALRDLANVKIPQMKALNREEVPTFAPATPTFSPPPDCHNCAILQAQLKARKELTSPRSSREDNQEILTLRKKVSELEDKSQKQEILLEKLRKERQEVLVTQLVGGSHDQEESLADNADDEDASCSKDPASFASQMQEQELLIMSIKEQLLKLSSQIRNGQRIRAIRTQR